MQIIFLYTQKLQLKPWKNVIDLNSCTPVDTRRRYNVFIVNFEHISHFVLVILLLTLNM